MEIEGTGAVDEVVDAVALPQVPRAIQVVVAVPKESVAVTEGAIEEDIEGAEEAGEATEAATVAGSVEVIVADSVVGIAAGEEDLVEVAEGE